MILFENISFYYLLVKNIHRNDTNDYYPQVCEYFIYFEGRVNLSSSIP